jgi:hypothetical protein
MALVRFQGKSLRLIVTEHAEGRMNLRQVSKAQLIEVIETGIVKEKSETKAWVSKAIDGRTDNLIAASVVVEGKELIVITVMVNWEPT